MKTHLRYWPVLILSLLLCSIPISALAEEPNSDEPLSPIDLLEQMEAEAEARADFDTEWDQHTEPYQITRVIALEKQAFMPLVMGIQSATTATKPVEESFPRSPLLPQGDYLTPEDIAELEASQAAAEAYSRELYEQAIENEAETAGIDAVYAVATTRSVSGITDNGVVHHERQNDPRAFNYCGPATIKVAIDATVPKSLLPWHDHIANALETESRYRSDWHPVDGQSDPGFIESFGTSGYAMCRYLHYYYIEELQFSERYQKAATSSSSSSTLWLQVVRHVDKNYTVPTGTYTSVFDDWTRNVYHINAILGYDGTLTPPIAWDMNQIRIAETAGQSQGYQGNHLKVWYDDSVVWNAVRLNNVQCLLKAGV